MDQHAGGTLRAARHPLDPLDAAEITLAVAVLRAKAPVSDQLRFISINLHEPDKEALGRTLAPTRIAEAIVLDLGQARTLEVMIDLEAHRVLRWREVREGQPGIVIEEFIACEAAVKADPRWQAALARRGIAEVASAIVDPWSAGAYGDERYAGRRLAQALTWIRGSDDDVGYGRPVEGLVTWVDLATMTVLEVVDEGDTPLPPLTGQYTAASVGPLRDDLRPLDIVQPDGPSFSVDGQEVRWQRWRFRIGFTSREGLVLHQLGYDDPHAAGGPRLRPILHRASLAEMQVPYGDPTVTHNKKNVFDVGEYGIGRMANSLTLGCDCLGTIRYFDAHFVTMAGEAETLTNAICLHEEDDGTLWKHTDWRTNHTEVRRSRRLVISFFATVGNYDYGFYWYLHQHGEIGMEVKLTGCLSVGALPPGIEPSHGVLVAPQLYAPIHQHFFSVRLDMDVDGPGNSLYETESIAEPEGEGNPYGGSYRPISTPIASEKDAARDAAPEIGRGWLVVNPSRINAVGRPTGYKLMPGADTVRPFAHPASSLMQRGGFIGHTLWATAYDPSQRYPAGEYVNQNPAVDGLPRWVTEDRSLENTDLVLWYTIGCHHIPRPEDWPVMPVARSGFSLKPAGFFDRNPAMDVAPPVRRSSCCA